VYWLAQVDLVNTVGIEWLLLLLFYYSVICIAWLSDIYCIQCFDTVGYVAGRASSL